MADAEKLLGQIAFVFITSVFPSALIGLFPLWLALRRGRPQVGVAALLTCVAAAFATLSAAGTITDLFTAIVLGVLAGVLVAAAWSFVLLRRAT